MDKAKAPTGISLTDRERDIVVRESERRGLHNFSAMVRMIINEWHELTSPTPPENGGQTGENQS
jgi:hypothetical protein